MDADTYGQMRDDMADDMADWPNPFDRDDLQFPTRQQSGDDLRGPLTTRLIAQIFGRPTR